MTNSTSYPSAGLSGFFPWYQGWTVLGAMMAVQAFGFGVYSSFTFWVNPWMEEFGASRSQIMLALMTTNLAMSLLSPFVGKAMDSIPIHRIVATGILIFAIGMVLIARATSIIQIIMIYALLIGLALTLAGTIASQTLMVRWFSRRRGLALGLVSVGASIGGFLFPPIVTFLEANIGWRTSHIVLAAIAVVVFIPLVLLLIRGPDDRATEQETRSNNSADTPPPTPTASQGPVWTVATVLRSRDFFPLVICLMPMAVTMSIFSSNFGPYTADLGIPAQQASFALSFFAMTMIGGKVLVSMICDYLDFRLVFTAVTAVLLVATFILTTSPSYLELMIASLMIGFSAGSFTTLMAAIVGRQFGARSFGLVAGMLFFANSWTVVLLPVSAWVRDSFGSYNGVWWTLMGGGLFCALFMLRVRPQPRV